MLRHLKQYDIRPKRSLGQNFLVDGDILKREVAYAELRKTDTVLEIGAGIGNLTERLLQQAGKVVAIEKDRQFVRRLRDLQKQYVNLEVIWGDALEMALPPFDKLVANLPFKPALPLIFKIVDCQFERAVLICQKRLAGRICASVGENGYCRLSVAIGRQAEAELLEVVRPTAFSPPPEVESGIVKIRKIRPKFQVPSEEFFRQLLEGLFAQREGSVEQAARAIRDKRFKPRVVDRALGGLGGKIRNKPVFMVTPVEFGKIARAFWDAMEAGGRR
jgi:16S rRNA (adenine1518-N6/adenine1519-N6)-dimethyltransferase